MSNRESAWCSGRFFHTRTVARARARISKDGIRRWPCSLFAVSTSKPHRLPAQRKHRYVIGFRRFPGEGINAHLHRTHHFLRRDVGHNAQVEFQPVVAVKFLCSIHRFDHTVAIDKYRVPRLKHHGSTLVDLVETHRERHLRLPVNLLDTAGCTKKVRYWMSGIDIAQQTCS